MNNLLTFITSENGNSTVSYCLLSGTITAAITGPLQQIGLKLAIVFMTIANALTVH